MSRVLDLVAKKSKRLSAGVSIKNNSFISMDFKPINQNNLPILGNYNISKNLHIVRGLLNGKQAFSCALSQP